MRHRDFLVIDPGDRPKVKQYLDRYHQKRSGYRFEEVHMDV